MDFTFKVGIGILTTAGAEFPSNIIGIFWVWPWWEYLYYRLKFNSGYNFLT